MILLDHEIYEICSAGAIQPFEPELLNPASLDVRLGGELLIESAESDRMVPYPLHRHDQENPYHMVPGQFVLAPTVEVFNIPDSICAEFRLKSSRGRHGMDHALAVWIDPGYHGSVLTIELKNNRQLHHLKLWPGMRIGQIVFHKFDGDRRPHRSYAVTGRYNNHLTVMGSLDETQCA